MDTSKIKVGKTYPYRYRSRTGEHAGTGKVVSVETKRTGDWVTVRDAGGRGDRVMRPSQVG